LYSIPERASSTLAGTQREREGERERERERKREREREREKERERERERAYVTCSSSQRGVKQSTPRQRERADSIGHEYSVGLSVL
jgi:hypothetical protein